MFQVFSATAMNTLVFKGPDEGRKKLYLYYDRHPDADANDGGHFIVCTKPHVILNTQYYCDVCNRGFNDKNTHK